MSQNLIMSRNTRFRVKYDPKSASVNYLTNIMSGQHSLNYTKHRPALKLHQLVQKIIIRNQLKTLIKFDKENGWCLRSSSEHPECHFTPKIAGTTEEAKPNVENWTKEHQFPFPPLFLAKSYFHFKVAQWAKLTHILVSMTLTWLGYRPFLEDLHHINICNEAVQNHSH